jgi:predicted MFS family arabinose efflux permease
MRKQMNASPHITNAWSAVFSMSLCVAILITSEFMPISLLTPIADGLNISQGQAGQAISISGLFAVLASLLITTVAGQVNRKIILIAMTSLLLISLVMIASAPNYTLLMIARAILGICVGGFWSLGTAVIMRLVSKESVPKAISIMFTGQAVAAAFAAPIGSYLGDIIGWRGVFWGIVPIVIINLVWQLWVLPSMPANEKQSFGSLLSLLKRRYFVRGLVASLFVFAGAFSMFTYLRPFLESVTQVSVVTLSQLLLMLGVAGFLGSWLGGKYANSYAIKLVQTVPIVMALVTMGLLGFGHYVIVTALLLIIWGVMNTAMSIGWMSWLSQNIDDAPEAAGSLFVATVQVAIMMGAAIGGILLDHISIYATFIGSASLSIIAIIILLKGHKLRNPANV